MRDIEAMVARREGVSLQNPGLIPGEEIETYRTKRLTAKADREVAAQAVKTAELNLRDSSVRAPIAGIIQTRTIETGQYVPAGYVMATLLRRDPLLLRFQVEPSARTYEAPYIERNIAATRAAYGVDGVQEVPYSAKTDAEPGEHRTAPGSRAAHRQTQIDGRRVRREVSNAHAGHPRDRRRRRSRRRGVRRFAAAARQHAQRAGDRRREQGQLVAIHSLYLSARAVDTRGPIRACCGSSVSRSERITLRPHRPSAGRPRSFTASKTAIRLGCRFGCRGCKKSEGSRLVDLDRGARTRRPRPLSSCLDPAVRAAARRRRATAG